MRKLMLIIMTGFVFFFSIIIGSQGIAESAEPIKIGFLAPYVGVFTKFGADLRDGFKLYLGEVGYKAAGRQIVLLEEDDEGKPEVGLVKTRKLIEKEQVHILTGIINSPVAYAVRDYVISKKIPFLVGNAGATKLTQELRDPLIFRSSFANGQDELAAGWYAYAKLNARKVVVMTSDYAGGHENADSFMKTFKLMGGEVIEEIYPPLGTNDFAPFFARLAKHVGKVDRLWVFFPGSDGIRFINQYAEYGLKEKIKLFCQQATTDEAILPSQKEAALGVESYGRYYPRYDTPVNKRFAEEYEKKYKMDPSSLSEGGYDAAKFIVTALEAVKGSIENQKAFLKALKSVKFEAPRGPIRLDEHQNVVFNVYIVRVEKREGKYNNYIFDTIPNVDQYWMPKK